MFRTILALSLCLLCGCITGNNNTDNGEQNATPTSIQTPPVGGDPTLPIYVPWWAEE